MVEVQKLSALLGREVKQIRKTDENLARVSVIDVAVVMTGRTAKYASEALCNICKDYLEFVETMAPVEIDGKSLADPTSQRFLQNCRNYGLH